MSLSALRWPKVGAIEEMQTRSGLRLKREVKSGGERDERDEKGIVLLTTLMASSVRRERARRSWGYEYWSEKGKLLQCAFETAGRARE